MIVSRNNASEIRLNVDDHFLTGNPISSEEIENFWIKVAKSLAANSLAGSVKVEGQGVFKRYEIKILVGMQPCFPPTHLSHIVEVLRHQRFLFSRLNGIEYPLEIKYVIASRQADLSNIVCKNLKDHNGMTAVDWALSFGSTHSHLLKQLSLSIENDLISACTRGDLEAVKDLISRGVNTDCITPSKETPLFFAVANDHFDVAEMLLFTGADPNHCKVCVDRTYGPGETIINFAFENENIKLVELLLKFNASPNSLGGCKSPLEYAIGMGNTGLVELLLDEYDANPNHVSTPFMTPFLAAILKGSVEIVLLFLEHGADPNEMITNNFNPFHFAIMQQKYAIVELLLNYGADPRLLMRVEEYVYDDCGFVIDQALANAFIRGGTRLKVPVKNNPPCYKLLKSINRFYFASMYSLAKHLRELSENVRLDSYLNRISVISMCADPFAKVPNITLLLQSGMHLNLPALQRTLIDLKNDKPVLIDLSDDSKGGARAF